MNKLDNIVELRPNSSVQLLEQLLDMAKKGDLDKLVFAGTNKANDIISGSLNTTPYDEQTLISYLQLNTFQKFMSCKKNTIIDK
jgi:hypothetical protein